MSGEKPDVTPDAEGFYGVPDAVIDDPDGYVNLRKEKSADSPIIARVKEGRAVRVSMHTKCNVVQSETCVRCYRLDALQPH